VTQSGIATFDAPFAGKSSANLKQLDSLGICEREHARRVRNPSSQLFQPGRLCGSAIAADNFEVHTGI